MDIASAIKKLNFFTRTSSLFKIRIVHKEKQKQENLKNDSPTPALFPRTFEETTGAKKRYLKSGLNEERLNDYENVLIRYIEKSKVYLNAELTLENLSDLVKIPKHHITQVLNDKLKKNFYVFINEYRIKEAAKKLKADQNPVNLLSLAFDCGFNSKSSFNNYFKKIMEETPSSYRKKFSHQVISNN